MKGALAALATGQSLLSFCRAKGLAYATVWEWINPAGSDNPAYTRAKEAGTHYMADECLQIADDSSRDVEIGEDGQPVNKLEIVQRARLRIDTRLRLIGKWNRKSYGEKSEVEHTGKLSLESLIMESLKTDE